MRVATWNLERPSLRSWKRLPRQRARMAEIDADIWVLTETRAAIAPAAGFVGIHTPPHPVRRPDPDERWVSIWSRWPLKPTSVEPDPRGSVSAIVDAPSGPLIIYGSVLPWANEKGKDGQARMWQVHYEEIHRQGEEWRWLTQEHPGLPLIVAGDLNQDRDGSGWYGTRQGRELLTGAFARANLECLTEEDVVAAGKLAGNHLVDHIAASRAWVTTADASLSCWEKTDGDGVRLSDHPTVVVDLQLCR
jgi:endonuclease/exonuclease/phosphatase family metal-dependent hydrolase